ncbi:hypothetical protein ACFFRR_001823 [Megaselia abdita]
MSSLAAKKILIKDGGFATQLSLHFKEQIDGDPLWSARANAVNPKAVIQSHFDFLKNGADLILTNTYQASVEGYMEYLELDEDQSIELIKSTVELAKTARDEYMDSYKSINPEDRFDNSHPLIVASIGPYGAHLHDGSEYTGSYADYVKSDEIIKWHRTRIEACIEAGVDALAVETIPCQMEAEAVVDLLCDEFPDTKFWVSFQCKVVRGSCIFIMMLFAYKLVVVLSLKILSCTSFLNP